VSFTIFTAVPKLPTESPTAITDGHNRRNSSVSISQRVGKKLRVCATITDGIIDGNHRRTSPTEYFRRYFTESWKKITGLCHHYWRNQRRNYRWMLQTEYSVGNLVAGIYFCLAHLSVYMSIGIFVFLLPTKMATELELPTLMTPRDLFRQRHHR